MVECEYALCDVSSDVRTVLIDTWWNVNNKSQKFWKENSFGFNRYMVECELMIKGGGLVLGLLF